MNAARLHLSVAAVGVTFGWALSRIGFSSFDEVNHMFTFESLRMTLAFGGSVAILAVAFHFLKKRYRLPARPFHKGSILGGVLFGAGWAICGACPSIVLVQIGEGQLAALVTGAGVLLGSWLFHVLRPRFFAFDQGDCGL